LTIPAKLGTLVQPLPLKMVSTTYSLTVHEMPARVTEGHVIGQPVRQEFNGIREYIHFDRLLLMLTKFPRLPDCYAIRGDVIFLPLALKEYRQSLSNKGRTTAGK
jgi:hypothetical protein